MAVDIAPELIADIQKAFVSSYQKSTVIKKTLEKIENGTANYSDAYRYSVEVGNIRAKAFKLINSSKLPDGKMYYNIANRLINETLVKDYKLVSEYTEKVINSSNKASKIGLKAKSTGPNKDRIDGFIQRLSDGEQFDDIAWLLDEPIRTFSQSIVDETIQRNAEFQHNAGLSVSVVRIPDGGCCRWCDELGGEYFYPGVPGEVFSRHDNCRCTIEYNGSKLGANGHSFR